MIQSYGQQYAPSSPESGSLDDESQMGPELDSLTENTVQPHTSGELFKHCIIFRATSNYNVCRLQFHIFHFHLITSEISLHHLLYKLSKFFKILMTADNIKIKKTCMSKYISSLSFPHWGNFICIPQNVDSFELDLENRFLSCCSLMVILPVDGECNDWKVITEGPPHFNENPFGVGSAGTVFRLHFLGSVEVDEEGGRKRRKRLKKNMVEVAVTKIKVCLNFFKSPFPM